ncbi:RDD family protein [Fulvivirga ligni]|uniref:RDD family protein n=1 Tax=Fulvivirga ligni TaxID=2904246 RepID=UPI001F457C47|nr:RDD family protein [Fulvivirga ligni]UII22277.1 RDD family protein [Fulvivirga ligni]
METTLDMPSQDKRPLVYAGFWLRFLALIIDSILVYIAVSILFAILTAMGMGYLEELTAFSRNRGVMDQEQAMEMFYVAMRALAIISLFFNAAYILYYSLMESSGNQATLGKMAVGLKVTDLNGERLTFGKAIVRNVCKILSTIVLYIGWIIAGFTEKKQALHDILASTLVLKK